MDWGAPQHKARGARRRDNGKRRAGWLFPAKQASVDAATDRAGA
jgi:hypothetical protein